MNALGLQLMLDLKGCNRELLNDLPYIRNCMLEAVREIGAHTVGETFHQFSPHGITGVVAIAESHLSIHTWPEYEYAAVDIFTCGTDIQPRRAAETLIQRLQCKEPSIIETKRGIISQPVPSH